MTESTRAAATEAAGVTELESKEPLEPLGSDGPDDVPSDADADELARSRGDAGDEHASFTVDRDDPRHDDGGNLMPKPESP